MEGEVKFGEKILSPNLLWSKLLLGGEVAHYHIVGEDCEGGVQEVVAPCPHAVDHGGHLLMHWVLSLSVVELLVFEGDQVASLYQYSIDGVIWHICVHLEGERKIGEVEDMF